MRRTAACAAAGLMILCMLQRDAPSAYASGETPGAAEKGTVEFLADESSASAESELRGRIRVDLISVELPAGGLEFSINAAEPFSLEHPGEQIQSPAIRVANHSVVPVKVEVSQVAEMQEEDVRFSPKFGDGNGPEQKFRLMDRLSEVGAPGTAVLVLGTSGAVYRSEAEFEQYAILPGRENIFVARIEANGSTSLNLYGKISPDFYGEYEFTVRPTIKISTVNAAD